MSVLVACDGAMDRPVTTAHEPTKTNSMDERLVTTEMVPLAYARQCDGNNGALS